MTEPKEPREQEMSEFERENRIAWQLAIGEQRYPTETVDRLNEWCAAHPDLVFA